MAALWIKKVSWLGVNCRNVFKSCQIIKIKTHNIPNTKSFFLFFFYLSWVILSSHFSWNIDQNKKASKERDSSLTNSISHWITSFRFAPACCLVPLELSLEPELRFLLTPTEIKQRCSPICLFLRRTGWQVSLVAEVAGCQKVHISWQRQKIYIPAQPM